MSFISALNMYCEIIPCNAGEIAAACGVSPSALSRYRSGQRMPTSQSKVIPQMAKGITTLLRKYEVDPTVTEQDVLAMLMSGRAEEHASAARFSDRLDQLISVLGIRNKDLARAVGIDASYVSRIRHGKRAAHDKVTLALACAQLAVKKCLDEGKADALPSLEGLSVGEVSAALVTGDSRADLADLLVGWLIGVRLVEIQTEDILQVLKEIDGFDYGEARERLLADPYWDNADAGMARDDSQFFYGLEGAREAELKFIGELLQEPQPGTVIACSSLATEALISDQEYFEHHQSGLMRHLERGGRMEVIHDLRRPFSEILLGVKYWLPLYLTGRVRAYYLDYVPSDAFRLAVYASKTCVFSGEDVEGAYVSRRCLVAKRPADVQHCRRKANAIRSLARPFFDLYRTDDPVQRQEYEKDRAWRLEHLAGAEVAVDRFKDLHVVSYPGDCSVLIRTDEPQARAVVRQKRANEILAHLDEVFERRK